MQVCGIYKIENIIDNKFYIGSSYDIGYRFKSHISRLKNNRHTNNHLQNAINKYGLESFTFSIIEECEKEQLIEREQYHIDNNNWTQLYNKTKTANGGGSDVLQIELYLLDLKGNIINQYKSGVHLAIDLKLSITPYVTINTSAILKKQYRIVTVQYYNTNLDTILKWKPYSNETKHKSLLYYSNKYKVEKDGVETLFTTKKSLSDFIGVSYQRVTQIFQLIDSQQINKYVHKKTGFVIQYVKKNL